MPRRTQTSFRPPAPRRSGCSCNTSDRGTISISSSWVRASAGACSPTTWPIVSGIASAFSSSRPDRSSIPRMSTTSVVFRMPAWRSISAATRSGRAGIRDSQNFIGEKPQLNFGGRSIFWSGLIPSIQGWELDFFPPRVRQDLESGLLNQAGDTMNEFAIDGSDRAGHRDEAAAEPAGPRFFHPGNTARPSPALPGARRDAQGPVLHRADRRVQHGGAAHQPDGADPGGEAMATVRACTWH